MGVSKSNVEQNELLLRSPAAAASFFAGEKVGELVLPSGRENERISRRRLSFLRTLFLEAILTRMLAGWIASRIMDAQLFCLPLSIHRQKGCL